MDEPEREGNVEGQCRRRPWVSDNKTDRFEGICRLLRVARRFAAAMEELRGDLPACPELGKKPGTIDNRLVTVLITAASGT